MTVTRERCADVVSGSASWEAHGSGRNIRLNKQSAKEVVYGTSRTRRTSQPENSSNDRTRGIIYFSVPPSASDLQQLAGPKSDDKQDDKATPSRQITAITLYGNVLVASSQADITPFTPRVTSYPSAVNDCCKARAGRLPITRGLSYRRVACRLVWRKLPRRFFVIPACVTGQYDPICFAGRTGRTEAGKRKMTNSRFCCLECLPRRGAWFTWASPKCTAGKAETAAVPAAKLGCENAYPAAFSSRLHKSFTLRFIG
jgi:hypothetical protein